MTWNGVKTWAAGEKGRSTDFNDYISDNLDYLFTRPTDMQRVNEGSNYTTTSTSFVDVDATDLSKTLAIKSGRALVLFACTVDHSAAAGGRVYFDIAVDGTRQGLDDGLVAQQARPGYVTPHAVTCFYPVTGLSDGNHTFKIQWKTDAATATIYAGAGTSGFDLHPVMFVLEY